MSEMSTIFFNVLQGHGIELSEAPVKTIADAARGRVSPVSARTV